MELRGKAKQIITASAAIAVLALGVVGWMWQEREKAVSVDVGTFSNAVGMDTAVAKELSNALRTHPETARVGIHWVVLGNRKGPLPFYLSYDRQSKILHEKSFSSGIDSEIHYVNTSEVAIHSIAARNAKTSFITAYGARTIKQPSLLTRLKWLLKIR